MKINLLKKIKKTLLGTVLAVSVLATGIAPASTVKATSNTTGTANKAVKPSLTLKKTSMAVGIGSTLELKYIVKSFKPGSAPIKSIRISAPKAVRVTNEKNLQFWKDACVKFKQKGTFRAKITVTDKNNLSTTKTVKFKVGKSITRFVDVSKPLRIKQNSNPGKIKFMKDVKYDKKHVKSVVPQSFGDVGFITTIKGTQKIRYTVTNRKGEMATVTRKAIVY